MDENILYISFGTKHTHIVMQSILVVIAEKP